MPVLSSLKLTALGLLLAYLFGVVSGLDVPGAGGAGGGGLDKTVPGLSGTGEVSHPYTNESIKDVLTCRQGAWERQFRVLVLIKFSILT